MFTFLTITNREFSKLLLRFKLDSNNYGFFTIVHPSRVKKIKYTIILTLSETFLLLFSPKQFLHRKTIFQDNTDIIHYFTCFVSRLNSLIFQTSSVIHFNFSISFTDNIVLFHDTDIQKSNNFVTAHFGVLESFNLTFSTKSIPLLVSSIS